VCVLLLAYGLSFFFLLAMAKTQSSSQAATTAAVSELIYAFSQP